MRPATSRRLQRTRRHRAGGPRLDALRPPSGRLNEPGRSSKKGPGVRRKFQQHRQAAQDPARLRGMGPAHDEARSLRPWLADETKSFRAVRQTISGHSLYGETPSQIGSLASPPGYARRCYRHNSPNRQRQKTAYFLRHSTYPSTSRGFPPRAGPGRAWPAAAPRSGGADVLQHLDRRAICSQTSNRASSAWGPVRSGSTRRRVSSAGLKARASRRTGSGSRTSRSSSSVAFWRTANSFDSRSRDQADHGARRRAGTGSAASKVSAPSTQGRRPTSQWPGRPRSRRDQPGRATVGHAPWRSVLPWTGRASRRPVMSQRSDPAVLPGRGQQRAVRRDGDRMHDAVMALQLQANSTTLLASQRRDTF